MDLFFFYVLLIGILLVTGVKFVRPKMKAIQPPAQKTFILDPVLIEAHTAYLRALGDRAALKAYEETITEEWDKQDKLLSVRKPWVYDERKDPLYAHLYDEIEEYKEYGI